MDTNARGARFIAKSPKLVASWGCIRRHGRFN
jgi:hypothetical protein